ncbi:MAG TPA: peroxiredoxin family protein [Solimonas sp.]|nr:peroxiredoxin family protein [Solimonas sp.]
MKHVACALVATCALLAGQAQATEFFIDETAKPAPVADIGLPSGKAAPSFTLKDADGHPVSLESLLGKGPVALVFFRSADWCGYCKLQLTDLQKNLPEIKTTGAQLVGISYDPPEILKRFSKNRISFPLLSDRDSATIAAYGVLNQTTDPEYAGIARHSLFVLDSRGVIRAKLYQVSYAERPAVERLLAALRAAR